MALIDYAFLIFLHIRKKINSGWTAIKQRIESREESHGTVTPEAILPAKIISYCLASLAIIMVPITIISEADKIILSTFTIGLFVVSIVIFIAVCSYQKKPINKLS